MNLKNIIAKSQKPALYEKGSAVMWTDEYISKQLLKVHLNEEADLASRKPESIKRTIDWILDRTPGENLKILDLGCGPGLYDILFAAKGHAVTGVDFSKNSVEYARKEAKRKGLDIKYINANYLELDMEQESFDLVIMIYTDLGVLTPEEREQILKFVYKVLKPCGTFIFDVLNDKDLEKKVTPKSWEAAEKGFWKPEPYLVLSESFLYKKEKVILYQHFVADENESIDIYRFWTHFYSHSDLDGMLRDNSFKNVYFDEGVLAESGLFGGDNVTFCLAEKD